MSQPSGLRTFAVERPTPHHCSTMPAMIALLPTVESISLGAPALTMTTSTPRADSRPEIAQ